MGDLGNKASSSLKYSLIALAGAGVAVSGCTEGAVKPEDAPKEVAPNGGGAVATKVRAPESPRVELPDEWQRVEIRLTADQIRDLGKLGVETDKLTITTYDISQLSSVVVN